MEFTITSLGWDSYFEAQFDQYHVKGHLPARVISRLAAEYRLYGGFGECKAVLSGKFLHRVQSEADELPVVGDWVTVEFKSGNAMIHGLLARKTCFARKPAISGGRKMKNGLLDGGTTARQALAANIDTVFIVCSLDCNFNLARIERFLTVALASGAEPVLIMNKTDLCADPAVKLQGLARVGGGCPVYTVSAASGAGMDAFSSYMRPGRTIAFLGPSGVGKSTLINRLFGTALMSTGEVNTATGRGRHTTTRAELLLHESGSILIDTPGIRELQLWCDSQAVQDSFEDVANLIANCRYSDCSHTSEPGCAIREALENGTLDAARYRNYRKLDEEAVRLEARKRQKGIYLGRKERSFWGKA